jgi:ribulose-phosphate 3-epimerase
MLEKVKNLKTGNFLGQVDVDGGVNAETIGAVVEAGADAAVVGSDLWKAGKPEEEYRKLIEVIK